MSPRDPARDSLEGSLRGDAGARERLVGLIYDDLHELARKQLARAHRKDPPARAG